MNNDQTEKRPPGATQDERLLETPRPDEFLRTDTWRVFRIMGEFVQGFEDLAQITNGVAVFGSPALTPTIRFTRRPGKLPPCWPVPDSP